MGYVLVVTSGEYKGRYVGLNISDLRWNPANRHTPEVPVPSTPFSLFINEKGANLFPAKEVPAVQFRLKRMGIETELSAQSAPQSGAT